ncbi:MAG: glycerol-3-phosphate cytidylyltransferase [Polyangiales bacterium]|jgi:glycerol-3-phosphate cytidylyltransferase
MDLRPESTVITFGTFDVLHVGHVRIFERAARLGHRLVVGVSSDELNFRKKGRRPVYSEDDRMEIVSMIRFVDEVFLEDSLELKGEYIRQHQADKLVMGDDWVGRFDEYRSLCEVVYLPRTEGVSTTSLIEEIGDRSRSERSKSASLWREATSNR